MRGLGRALVKIITQLLGLGRASVKVSAQLRGFCVYCGERVGPRRLFIEACLEHVGMVTGPCWHLLICAFEGRTYPLAQGFGRVVFLEIASGFLGVASELLLGGLM
jgi:hypothetical protein